MVSRPFRTGTHPCLRKFSLSHHKGLMWKYKITEEAPCTGVSNSHLKLLLPFLTNTHNTVHWLFLVVQFQECSPPQKRRKKEAVHLLATPNHNYSRFSSNFSSCHLPKAESCLSFAVHFISIIISCHSLSIINKINSRKKKGRIFLFFLVLPS